MNAKDPSCYYAYRWYKWSFFSLLTSPGCHPPATTQTDTNIHWHTVTHTLFLFVSGGCFLTGTSRTALNPSALARWVRTLGGETRRSGSTSQIISKHTHILLLGFKSRQQQGRVRKAWENWHGSFRLIKMWLKSLQWSCHGLTFSLHLHISPWLSVQTVLLYLWVAVWKVLSWHTIHHRWNTSPVSYLRETSSDRDGTERGDIWNNPRKWKEAF